MDDMNDFQTKFPGGQFALHSVSEHHDVALRECNLSSQMGSQACWDTMRFALHLKASWDRS